MIDELAVKLNIKYTDVINGHLPFAKEVNGIEPYNLTTMDTWMKEFTELKTSTESSESTETPARLEATKCKSVVVNGCQVAWSSQAKPNIG